MTPGSAAHEAFCRAVAPPTTRAPANVLRAGPGNVQDVINGAPPGSVIELAPGNYGRLVFDGRRDLTLRGQPGVVFDGGVSEPRPPPLQITTKPDGTQTWPAVYPRHGTPGIIDVTNGSNNIRLENLTIRNAWPNGVRIADSQNITISGLDMEGGTNAVAAVGRTTRGITIERSTWTQDPSGRVWSAHDWQHVHHGRLNHYNGAFFQGRDIGGDVTIRDNTVRNAFNGVRIKSQEDGLGDNVRVENNRFYNISDNVIEPEARATNWRIVGNHMQGFHAPISLDGVRGHSIVFERNRLVATERPRMAMTEPPSDGDRHNGARQTSRFFKLLTDGQPPPIDGLVLRRNVFVTSDYPIRLSDTGFPPGARLEDNTFIDRRNMLRE